MKIFFFIFGLISIPLIFFTLFAKTDKGVNLKLGSFYIIKNFSSKFFRVRDFKDKILLLLRLFFSIVICVLIFNPTNIEVPQRETIVHKPEVAALSSNSENTKKVILDLPDKILDSFNEDIFFLEAMSKNFFIKERKLTFIYNPDKKRIDEISGDIVVFPGPDQDRYALEKWANIFYLSGIQENKLKSKDLDYHIIRFLRPVFVDKSKISVYSKLENDMPVVFSIEDGDRRILIFSVGPSSFWGDIGITGYMLGLIRTFYNNITITENISGDLKKLKESGMVNEKLPHKLLLYFAVLFLLLEMFWFIFKSRMFKKNFSAIIILFLFLFSCENLLADDFKFIELDTNYAVNNQNRIMFSIIKREVEKYSSVRIDPAFYKKFTIGDFLNGKMPEVPFLWVVGCKGKGFFSGRHQNKLENFLEKGGIIFILTCGSPDDTSFFYSLENFSKYLIKQQDEDWEIPELSKSHPLFKSFFLLQGVPMYGVNISRSTRRTAFIVSRQGLKNKILRQDKYSLRIAVNIILYMLSGNYKSDQVHTRQILRKLKKRELYK